MFKLKFIIVVNFIVLVAHTTKTNVHALSAIPLGELLSPKHECGVISESDTKNVWIANRYPWMALIGYTDLNNAVGKEGHFGFGGTLITTRHVLTAAHFIHDLRSHGYEVDMVRLGEHDTSKTSNDLIKDIKVNQTTIHEHFDKEIIANDIAILTLETDAFLTKHIRPICLPIDESARSRNYIGVDSIVAGWGDHSTKGAKAKILRQIEIPVLPTTDCVNMFGTDFSDERQICAGDVEVNECHILSDTGGPLMSKIDGHFYLIGIVSFGGEGCHGEDAGVYTRVSYYIDWIKSHLN